MAAYAALVSFMHIIDQIKRHPCPPISLDKEQIESLTGNVTFLHEFVEEYNYHVGYSDEADPLEMHIADAAYAAEDVIEAHIVDQLLDAGSENQGSKMGFSNCFRGRKEINRERINSVDLYQGLQKVIEEMDLIKKEVMEIVAENKLWVSEGFLKPISNKSLETVAIEYLKELVERNLILVDELGSTGNVKYCKIHDLLRDLCLREAQRERFYHVVGKHSPRGTYSQRRFVIPRSSSNKKDILDASESMPRTRSYVCDNERVGMLPSLRLVRTLKAYDTDTYGRGRRAHGHSKLPSSMKLLWNLQTLVVAHTAEVNAPIEIWEMSQLRHVQFYKRGVHLPDPPSSNIGNIELENSRGRKWPVTITSHGVGFAMTRGLPDFLRENHVQLGDILLFESVANSVANVVRVVVMANEAGKEMLARSTFLDN